MLLSLGNACTGVISETPPGAPMAGAETMPSPRGAPAPLRPDVAPLPPGVTSPAVNAAPLSPAPARRLTSQEYANSITDVLGFDPTTILKGLSPDPPGRSGLRNDAQALQPSPQRMAAYEKAAGDIAETIPWKGALDRFAGCPALDEACAKVFLRTLGRRLYRRPVEPGELDTLAGLVARARADGDTFERAARWALAAMLQSPQFLFRLEPAGPPNGFALASRLSFLLWKSAPDEPLLTAAEQGELSRADGLPRAIERMLADPRGRRGLGHLVEDWLQLYTLETAVRSPAKFPMFGATLIAELKAETLALFSRLVFDERADLMAAFTETRTDASPAIAKLYGLPTTAKEVRPYDLAARPERLGFLTHPGVLGTSASTDDASIVERGLWVLRTLLCQSPPPPPMNAAQAGKLAPPNVSERERFALHSQDPACAGCHSLFDGLGHAFEPFDALGRFQTRDEHGNLLRSDGAVLIAGATHTFANTAAFARLMAGSGGVQRCLVQKAIEYALGRQVDTTDDAFVDAVATRWTAGGRRMHALLQDLSAQLTAPAKED